MLNPDWTEIGTKENLEAAFGNRFKVRLGWTESKTDTIFCQYYKLPDLYKVFVWNRPGIRNELAALLQMDVCNI